MDVDPDTRVPDHPVDDRAARQLLPARPAAGAEDDLRRVQGARARDERCARVLADELAIAAAELLDERALSAQGRVGVGLEPVLRPDVDGHQVGTRPRGHPRGAADETVAVRAAREADEHTLARLPRTVDPVAVAIALERLVDAVGDPEEGELAQRAEVALPGK